MLPWFRRVEKLAKWLAQQYYFLGLLTIVAVVGIVLADSQLQLINYSSGRWIKKIGKGFGELTASIALVSLGYYLLREAYVTTVKRNLPVPSGLVPYIKSCLAILRLVHPLTGVIAIAFAVMHGYIMWVIWGGMRGGPAVSSGLITLLAALLLAGLGWGIQRKRESSVLRQQHKVTAFLVVVVYAFHKVIAD